MRQSLNNIVCQATGAARAERREVIQSLWSGYGEIVRYALYGAKRDSAVLKHVVFPSEVEHPFGWHNDRSHRRKVRSYEVEMAWYRDWAGRCGEHCRVPRCYTSATVGEEHLMVLEDLDAAGFSRRRHHLRPEEAGACLSWLAHFHATFLGEEPTGLWPVGSYWHLETRPDEWAAIEEALIRDTAPAMDAALSNCRFKTFIHGDAKVENFCFSADGMQVAAVDFQYVGGGCGMKDVAYFLGSCLDEGDQERGEGELLDYYFSTLQQALSIRGGAVDGAALEREWRALFPVAQADFYRFLVGWVPEHWAIHDYGRRVALKVVAYFHAGHPQGKKASSIE